MTERREGKEPELTCRRCGATTLSRYAIAGWFTRSQRVWSYGKKDKKAIIFETAAYCPVCFTTIVAIDRRCYLEAAA